MKAALCFIISYDHILTKEHIWREWINQNKDIFNVYFFYKDYAKIKSSWILQHTIPEKYIQSTSYYHVVPAYMSILNYAFMHDSNNEWFCMLTDSCCPIVSPTKFRYLFLTFFNKSVFNWKPAWWNIHLNKRANLSSLINDLRLANDPYFVLCRHDVEKVIKFPHQQPLIYKIVCDGGVANESLFAIILKYNNILDKVKQTASHLADWDRMMSATSPYLFNNLNDIDIHFIEKNLGIHTCAMFIRKVSPTYPDHV